MYVYVCGNILSAGREMRMLKHTGVPETVLTAHQGILLKESSSSVNARVHYWVPGSLYVYYSERLIRLLYKSLNHTEITIT